MQTCLFAGADRGCAWQGLGLWPRVREARKGPWLVGEGRPVALGLLGAGNGPRPGCGPPQRARIWLAKWAVQGPAKTTISGP